MRDVVVMMIAQFTQYLVLTINFRSIAHAQYAAIGASAAAASTIGYFMTRRVSRAETHWGLVGMTIGGALADILGTWLTRTWG